eukprot:scaffold147_cov164-Ochromonas_danica.AAC.21
MNCSIECFKAFASPYLYGKLTSSPSKLMRRKARHNLYESMFQESSTTATSVPTSSSSISTSSYSSPSRSARKRMSKHSYLRFAQQLARSSDRWSAFHDDEIATIVFLVEQNLTGYIRWDDMDAFGFVLDNELQVDPTHPDLVLNQLFLRLISLLYDKVHLDSIPATIKDEVHKLLKESRKLKQQPLCRLLCMVHEAGDDRSEWLGNTNYNPLCLDLIQELMEIVESPYSAEIFSDTNRLKPEESNEVDHYHHNETNELSSPLQSKLRDTLKSFERKAQELSERLDDADNALVRDKELWASLHSLHDDVEKVLTLEDQVISSPRGLEDKHHLDETNRQAQPPQSDNEDARSLTTLSTYSSIPSATPSTRPRFFNTRSLPTQLQFQNLLAQAAVPSSSSTIGQRSRSEAQRRKEAIQARYHQLREIYPVKITSKKKANLNIIRTPATRQRAGNSNYFDPFTMRWQPASHRKEQNSEKAIDWQFQEKSRFGGIGDRLSDKHTYAEIKYAREIAQMFFS